METRFYKKGTILFKEGEKSDEMYFIESGAVAILCAVSGPGSEKVPVNILKAGSLLGEFAFFDNKSRSATVMMMEDTKLKIIDRKALAGICKNGLFIIKALVEKMRTMNDHIKTSSIEGE